MSVERFLVSGNDNQLNNFHNSACLALNPIERREQTIFYTCMDENVYDVIETAKACGVTLQQMDSNKEPDEVWNTIVQGDYPVWINSRTAEGDIE